MTQPGKPATNNTPSLWQFKAFDAWVRGTLIRQFVVADANVCEFCCGTMADLDKWTKVSPNLYAGVDFYDVMQSGRPPKAENLNLHFYQYNLFENAGLDSIPQESFDAVACFGNKIHQCFGNPRTIETFLSNAACKLRDGGYFFGTVLDSSVLWTRMQKRASKRQPDKPLQVKGALLRVDFDSEEFSECGTRYVIRLFDTPPTKKTETVVHFPTLLSIAEQVGLEFVEIKNYLEFLQDYKEGFREGLEEAHVFTPDVGLLEKAQLEIIELYSTYVFRKKSSNQTSGSSPKITL
eukprot:Rmarinus@m.18549